jgi:hypothetical protein
MAFLDAFLAEIAARLKTRPHTVGRWRKEEDWDWLRRKIDRRAAEMFVEKIATDRTTLNVRHYRLWELVLANLGDTLKGNNNLDVSGGGAGGGDPGPGPEGTASGQGAFAFG